MTNIVKFSKKKAAQDKPQVAQELRPASDSAPLKIIWVITVLLWPILKWVIALDCVFQLMRTMYYWDTPSMYAGWKFMLHFAVLVGVTYFVSRYKPKGI